MDKVRKYLDTKIEPHFAKGGRYENLAPIYDLFDTIAYSPSRVTQGLCHLRDALDQKRMMIIVVMTLALPMAIGIYNIGYQAALAASVASLDIAGWRIAVMEFLGLNVYGSSFWSNVVYGSLYFMPVLLVTLATGGFWEVLIAVLRKHEVSEGFLVTAFLIPLTMPPTVPLWQVVVATSFGVVVGKEIFGGVGYNFLNPALTARAYLFFAYPAEMSGDAVWVAIDGYTQATPLAVAAVSGAAGLVADYTWMDAFLGFIPGSMGEVSTLACLAGAAILIGTRIGSWHVMSFIVLGMIVAAWFLNFLAPYSENPMFEISPMWHFVLGGYAFGLVYMATDPVSSAMTIKGKYIYGALIGVLVVFIRVINPAFPEGMMLAILFMNVFAPIIDHYVIQANVKLRLQRYGKRQA
ncbi:Na(+)-translocating NADH-quinone reductase subunit B [Spirochaetota bacterium]|nr:Na(+)-translocating NADH-quinone reductase subunit B [Spirochaetota bacterium]